MAEDRTIHESKLIPDLIPDIPQWHANELTNLAREFYAVKKGVTIA
jgi:hypothetical protein